MMTFKEFKKAMKQYNKFYEYVGFRGLSGYKTRHYIAVSEDGMTTIGNSFPAECFEDIVDYYKDMAETEEFEC